MPYIVVCEESDGAKGVHRSPVTNESRVVLHFTTIEEAARESSRLNRQAQAYAKTQHPATIPHYWVQGER